MSAPVEDSALVEIGMNHILVKCNYSKSYEHDLQSLHSNPNKEDLRFLCRRNWGWHAFEGGQELVLYRNQDINHHRIEKEKAWILSYYYIFQFPYHWSIDCNYVFWLLKKLKHDPMFALLARLDCQIWSSLWELGREYGHLVMLWLVKAYLACTPRCIT